MIDAQKALGRPELHFDLPDLTDQTILVTGSRGYIGMAVYKVIERLGGKVIQVDLPENDLLFDALVGSADFDAVIHLAAHKYAPMGEERPVAVSKVNIEGTANVVRAAGHRRVVFASTCKAADPCTVYGASKLIGERIVTNANGVAVRLVNVLDSTGSVLRIWSALPEHFTLGVTRCKRMWLTRREAAEALVSGLTLEPGLYVPRVPEPEPVEELAKRVYPARALATLPLRRGDRPDERLLAEYEHLPDDAGDDAPLRRVLVRWDQGTRIDL